MFQESLDLQKKEILNRLASSRREDVKTLAKSARDKDELLRRKREIDSEVGHSSYGANSRQKIYTLLLHT